MAEFTTRQDFDREIIERAVYFTSVVFLGRGRYHRLCYKTKEDAIAGAMDQIISLGTNKGSMVYAVDDRGHDTLVTVVRYKRS